MQTMHYKQQLFQSSCVFSLHKIPWQLCDWNKEMQISQSAAGKYVKTATRQQETVSCRLSPRFQVIQNFLSESREVFPLHQLSDSFTLRTVIHRPLSVSMRGRRNCLFLSASVTLSSSFSFLRALFSFCLLQKHINFKTQEIIIPFSQVWNSVSYYKGRTNAGSA